MSVAIDEGGLGTWMTFPSPAVGEGWTVTVPNDARWRVWGGGCQIACSAAVAQRIPGLIVSLGGTPFYVTYNVDFQDTAGGPTANQTVFVVYHDHQVLLPRNPGNGVPFPVGVPPMWLPPGTVLQGVFQSLQAADQISQLALLVESEPVPVPQIHVREKPPLRHTVSLTTPPGRHYRLAEDESDPANVPSGLRWSDTMPGGHESSEFTVPRKPGLDYPDLERLTDWRILGAGGEKCWQGRLERAPRTSGDEVSVSPAAVGHVAHLEDDKSVRVVYVDRDISHWQGPTATRQLTLTTANNTVNSATVEPDPTFDLPAIKLQHADEWGAARFPIVEALYDAGPGGEVGVVWYDAVYSSHVSVANPDWQLKVGVASDAELTSGVLDTGDLHGGMPTNGYFTATTPARYAWLRFAHDVASGGLAGNTYAAFFRDTAVYGVAGLTSAGTDPTGYYASDIVRHAVQTFAPMLTLKADSIQQSSFIVPHLAFLDPTTAGEVVRQASRFDLPDWAVWDDREFVWHQSGARGRTWRLRIGPSQLEETGPQVDRLWESVLVAYQDVDGSTRTVGPPGSGADTESSDVKDSDPDNPANKLGIVRRALLQMGTSTAAGATEVGRRFLEQSRLLDRSGKAKVVGWAEDDRGVLHPFSAVRSGDYAIFVDAADTSARKIVRTEKSHDDRTCTMDLDAPPEGLAQLLERLQVVLVPLGIG